MGIPFRESVTPGEKVLDDRNLGRLNKNQQTGYYSIDLLTKDRKMNGRNVKL